MKGLTILYGPPAAGKTTWAMSQPNTKHIDLDQLALEASGAVSVGSTFHSSGSVWRHAQELAVEALRDGDAVIFDYYAVQPVYRSQLRLLARRARARAHLVVIDADLTTCLARNAQRNHSKRLPDSMIHELYDQHLDDRERAQAEPWASVTMMQPEGATSDAT